MSTWARWPMALALGYFVLLFLALAFMCGAGVLGYWTPESLAQRFICWAGVPSSLWGAGVVAMLARDVLTGRAPERGPHP